MLLINDFEKKTLCFGAVESRLLIILELSLYYTRFSVYFSFYLNLLEIISFFLLLDFVFIVVNLYAKCSSHQAGYYRVN